MVEVEIIFGSMPGTVYSSVIEGMVEHTILKLPPTIAFSLVSSPGDIQESFARRQFAWAVNSVIAPLSLIGRAMTFIPEIQVKWRQAFLATARWSILREMTDIQLARWV